MFVYGIRLLIYYFSMARHMVGGKRTLYQAIIVLDLGLFTGSMISMSDYIVTIYLLSIFAFSGVIDILRSLEAKKNGASWRMKFITGCISVIMALALVVTGLVQRNTTYLVYGYCFTLVYSGIMRIVASFRKTAMVYIQ